MEPVEDQVKRDTEMMESQIGKPLRRSGWSQVLTAVAWFAFALIGLCMQVPASGSAVEASAETARAEQLVSQLGDASFKTRERAHRELLELGSAAKEPLLKALQSSDQEVRYRAEKILLVVLDLDFAHRLDAFTADVGGTTDYQLPTWSRFRELFGDTRNSRELFAAMQRAEGPILAAAAAEPNKAAEILESRCTEILETHNAIEPLARKDLTVASVAAFLFVATTPEVPVTTQSGLYLIHFCSYRSFQTAATGGSGKAELLFKLLEKWIEYDLASDVARQVAAQNLMMAQRLQMPAALVPAMQLLRSNAVPPQNMQHAIVAIAKYGSKEHLPLLEPLLGNETLLSNPPDQISIQIGDVALAAVIHLHGAKVEDFGFVHVRRGTDRLFEPQTLGFGSQNERRATMEKWRAWLVSQVPADQQPSDDEPKATEERETPAEGTP